MPNPIGDDVKARFLAAFARFKAIGPAAIEAGSDYKAVRRAYWRDDAFRAKWDEISSPPNAIPPRPPRKFSIPPNAAAIKRAFLEALERTRSFTLACHAANTSPSTITALSAADPEFRAARFAIPLAKCSPIIDNPTPEQIAGIEERKAAIRAANERRHAAEAWPHPAYSKILLSEKAAIMRINPNNVTRRSS